MPSNNKKRKLASKKNKKSTSLTFLQSREITSLIFFSTAVFFFLLDFFFDRTGFLGYWLYQTVGAMCGFTYFSFVWIYLCLAGFVTLFHKQRLILLLTCLASSYVFFVVLLDGLFFTLPVSTDNIFQSSRTGFLGAAFLWISLPLLGSFGYLWFYCLWDN
jgi:hypothetical protein